jgi:hypothetical protein
MEESRLVLLLLLDRVARLKEELLGCNAKYLPIGGGVETVTVLLLMPRLQQSTGAQWVPHQNDQVAV